LSTENEMDDAFDVMTLAPPETGKIHGVVVGTLAACDASGVWVDFPGNPDAGPVAARSTVPSANARVGREVALLFDAGDPRRPVVMGLMEPRASAPVQGEVDGRLVLSAEREVVLRCGDASITLTRAGKVLIRGEYVLSRASGVHRIRGGSVQIN
jgi:hypothetical protein